MHHYTTLYYFNVLILSRILRFTIQQMLKLHHKMQFHRVIGSIVTPIVSHLLE